MFSDNHRISDRQLQALLLADWMGKILLIQPGLTGRYSWLEVFAGTAAGLALTSVFLLLIMRMSWSSLADCYTYVKKHEGGTAAVFLYLIYFIYFFAQTVLVLFLCGEIAGTYLLPEYSRPVLLFLPAAVGYFLARGGLEIRGRVSELLAWLLAFLILIMLLFTVFQIRPPQFWRTVQAANFGARGGLSCLGLTASGFGSVFALPLILPETEQKKGWNRRLYLALGAAGLLLLLVYLCGYAVLGNAGMQRLSWPVISLLSCTDITGVFFQRWDVFLTALLLVSLFLSVGSGVYYMQKILTVLWKTTLKKKMPECREGKIQKEDPVERRVRVIALAAAGTLACVIREREQALYFYERITLWVCVPLMALTVLLVKRKKRVKIAVAIAVLLAAVSLLLTGCAARELESRCFPLVLEIDAEDGRIILGCAWPSVKEDAGKQQEKTEAESGADHGENDSRGRENGKTENAVIINGDKITRVTGSSLEDALKNMQGLRDQFVDYSQVQAILWGRGLEASPELRQEILTWLEEDPAFSGNILVFQGKTRDLDLETVQEHAQGQPGDYLKNLYKNNERFQEYTITLRELLYF